MKYSLITVTVSVALLALFPGTSPAQDKKQSETEQTITKIENEWADALIKADLTAISRFVAPEWTVGIPDGKLQSKAEADADLKTGALKIQSFKLDNLKVSVFGDTAIAQGLETEKSTYNGKDTSGQYRFMDVFVKRHGHWLAVATQITRVEKP